MTSGPPGVTGFAGGRPKATEIIGYWPALLSKDKVKTSVQTYSLTPTRAMPQVQLSATASARSGDKGEGSNVGLIAHSEAAYAFLRDALTEDVVRAHFAGINHGGVTRFAADNMRVLNFLLEDSLGGGGSASLKTDAQGKTHGLALLRMTLEVPDDVLASVQGAR